MTKPRRKFDLPPRGMNASEVAAYLGRSLDWLNDHLPKLLAAGFPKPLPQLELYDRAAIDDWLDRLGDRDAGGIVDHDAAWTEAAHG